VYWVRRWYVGYEVMMNGIEAVGFEQFVEGECYLLLAGTILTVEWVVVG